MTNSQNRGDCARTEEIYKLLVKAIGRMHHAGQKSKAVGGRMTFVEIFKSKRSVYERLRDAKGAISTGQLVELLANFREYCQQQTSEGYTPESDPPIVITAQDIGTVLMKLVELTPSERQRLGLGHEDADILMQQAFLQLWGNQSQRSYIQTLQFYDTSVNNIGENDTPLQAYSGKELSNIIKDMVHQHINGARTISQENSKGFDIDSLIGRYDLEALIINEINQIVLKAGVNQIKLAKVRGKNSYCSRYLPQGFIQKLVKSVTDNQILTSEFPVFIHSISVEKCGPFPLRISRQPEEVSNTDKTVQKSSLNRVLLELYQDEQDYDALGEDETSLDCSAIALQNTHKIKIIFYLKIKSQKISHKFPKVYKQLRQDNKDGYDFLFFHIDSIGFGGVLSHVTKLINNAVLTDICSASENIITSQKIQADFRNNYFPIAHDVLLNQQFPRNNVASPVWAHSVVMLCKNQALGLAMDKSRNKNRIVRYPDVSSGHQVAWGDYCGFDLLSCGAKAALNARLRAIKMTGIKANDYLQALFDRIEGEHILKESSIFVSSYPFSSFAQESLLNQTLLKDLNRTLNETDSYTLYVACLRIAENFLIEGYYRKAWPYIQKISEVLSRSTRWYDNFGKSNVKVPSFRVFSGSLVVRFTLCLAYYFQVVDADQEIENLGDAENFYLPTTIKWENPDSLIPWSQDLATFKSILIQRSWKALEAAEKHLYTRLTKYFIINEESQGTFHPHYKYLAQIYFLRAKLFLYQSDYIPVDPDFYRVPTENISEHQEKNNRRSPQVIYANLLYLFEQARLYAATDGDSQRYTCYTAYQCWIYVMASYLPNDLSEIAEQDSRFADFREVSGLAWARRLRDDALISYDDIGRQCYLKIKEKSGVSTRLVQQRQRNQIDFGNYQIEAIPVIRETFQELSGSQVLSNNVDIKTLELDMSLLAVDKEDLGLPSKEDDSGVVYLFGPAACYLFYARGMYHLASPYIHEFEHEDENSSATQTVKDEADWNTKFWESYRLFSYAWSIADDGGEIEFIEQPDVENEAEYSLDLCIKRPFTLPYENCLKEVAALRDLYPFRITEIAGFGRIFAAASLILYISLESDPIRRQKLVREAESLINDVHQTEQCQHLNQVRIRDREEDLLNGQRRYNGHLSTQLSQCCQVLRKKLGSQNEVFEMDEIQSQRDSFMRQLFEALRTCELS